MRIHVGRAVAGSGSANLCRAALATGLISMAMPAVAQEAPAAVGGRPAATAQAPKPAEPTTQHDGSADRVDDIVVTAQRRDERLQAVPVAITAFTSKTLAAAGVTDTTSLQFVTPGLVVGKGLTASTPFIRGIGSSDLGPSNEAGVAIYLDGIYLVASPSALFSLNNIERIEVLKGPQGTLFGRNATGGLIQIITREPHDTPGGRFDVSYANYNTVSGNGYITAGLGGGFSADLAVTGSHQGDGWGKNLFDGHDVYRSSEFGARAKLRWQGTNTDITLAMLYSGRDSTVGSSLQPYRGGGAGTLIGNFSFANVGKYNIDANVDPSGRVKTYLPSLSIKQDLGFATLVSLTSYQSLNSRTYVPQDGIRLLIAEGDLRTISRAGTQELQLVSPASSKLKWIVGAFALIRRGAYDPGLSYVTTGLVSTTGVQKTHSYSGYAQATEPLGESTNLTLGIRYTRDDQDASVSRTFNGVSVGPTSSTTKSYSNVTWRAAIDHHFTPDVMVYGSYNRGYKSGLFNLLNYPIGAGEAQPEKVDAYEAGFKSDLFDRKLRLNASAFLYNYSNLQVFFFQNGSAFTLNADRARIIGAEGEFTARPTRALTMRGGVTWLPEAKYTSFLNAPLTTPSPTGGDVIVRGDASGRRITRSPRITANAGVDYAIDTRLGTLTLDVSASYLSEFSWQPDARLHQDPYALVNAQARFDFSRSIWMSVWAKNLNNHYYYQYAQANQTGDVGVAGAPRTFGATVGYAF